MVIAIDLEKYINQYIVVSTYDALHPKVDPTGVALDCHRRTSTEILFVEQTWNKQYNII